MVARSEPVAVGSLPGGGWVGMVAADDGFRLVVGAAPPSIDEDEGEDQRATLTALAIVHFEEALGAPPPGVEEATHREMAELLRWLERTATGPEERRLAELALDAVEDGLPGDAVALRLMTLLGAIDRGTGASDAPPEALELVLARARAARDG